MRLLCSNFTAALFQLYRRVGYTWNVRQYSTADQAEQSPDKTPASHPPGETPATPPVPQPKGLDVRAITESALLMDVTVLLVLLRVLFPVPGLQGIIRLACPIPFVLLALRRGPRAGIVATVASFVLLSCFVGPILAAQNIIVFGGLGTLFAWAAQHRWRSVVTVVVGATLYGLGYLLPPFLFGLYVLRINLGHVLREVHNQANSFLTNLGHIHVVPPPLVFGIVLVLGLLFAFSLGSKGLVVVVLVLGMLYSLLLSAAPRGATLLSTLDSVGPGRVLLRVLYPIAFTALTHPLATLIVFFAGYSLINVWAYLVVGIEVFRRLPDEARRDARGRKIDFFPVG